MKKVLLIGLLLGVFSSAQFYAQAVQPGGTPSKIVVVDTSGFFDEKAGITRILTAVKSLNAELLPRRTELQQMISRVQLVEKEVATFRENVAKGIPVDERAAQAKSAELERMKLSYKYKEDDYNSFAQKRQSQVVGPEFAAALKAFGEYVKSKGYRIVFDVSKDQNGFVIFATDQFDITRDFITFYNTRPPSAINSVPK